MNVLSFNDMPNVKGIDLIPKPSLQQGDIADNVQRLKGAIDSRIAEEQARQRTLQTQQGRSPSAVRRQGTRTASPAVRGDKTKDSGLQTAEKGPDPKEFEQTFLIDDDETSTRAGTPQPNQEKQLGDTKDSGESKSEVVTLDGGDSVNETNAVATSAPTVELPPEVKAKLRKLERLEPKWQEFLRSYKIAHARVQEIEVFEAALRENTPLTSIQDSGALTEYLNQLRLKSDMVLDEMKRLSVEKDSLKNKLADAERKNLKYEAELTTLKSTIDSAKESPQVVVSGEEMKTAQDPAQIPISPKIRTPSIAGFSLFSPKAKPVDHAAPTESEEFFSYDNELPRLQSELKTKSEEVTTLQKEIKSLQSDLEVARESTQSMAKSLEDSTREVTSLKEKHERAEGELTIQKSDTEAKIVDLHMQLEVADRKLRELEAEASSHVDSTNHQQVLQEQQTLLASANDDIAKLRLSNQENAMAFANVSKLEDKISSLEASIKELEVEKTRMTSKTKILDNLVATLKKDISSAEGTRMNLKTELETSTSSMQALQQKLSETETKLASVTSQVAVAAPLQSPATTTSTAGTANKKKNNKKKKGGKQTLEQNGQPSTSNEAVAEESRSTANADITALQEQVAKLTEQIQEKDAAIDRLSGKIKDQDELKEEIESLRDDLINVGQEHVTAKDKLKELGLEKKVLEASVAELEKELVALRSSHNVDSAGSQQAHKDLADQFSELKLKATNLETDLTVAQQLASSRFKDLTDLRSVLQKAQPELSSLRKENTELKDMKKELGSRVEDLQKIESRQTTMRTELADVRRKLGEKDSEAKALQQKLTQDSSGKQKAEEECARLNQDLQRVQREKEDLIQNLDRTSNDLTKTKEDLQATRARVRDIEETINKIQREADGLKEDIQLKTAQHASAESLMHSMRDQTSEMATQTKEARERVESLEEEIADAHRLLNERNREAGTMRRLLAEVEGRADIRVREMKERLDVALEERDKAEDDASTASRRRARELEDLRSKVREVQRELKEAEEEKENLQELQKDWKKRREDLEHGSEVAVKEVEEVRRAMSTLRDALDESEKQARELEKQKSDLRRNIEDMQQRLDRAQKSNKVMAEEVKSIQAKSKPQESQGPSVRSSIDSMRPQSRGLSSPTTRLGSNTPSSSTDTVNGQGTTPSTDYLKNVLLQFLEQKDKKHQMQLVPVLGVLLHFDRKDEQKWMAAISAR